MEGLVKEYKRPIGYISIEKRPMCKCGVRKKAIMENGKLRMACEACEVVSQRFKHKVDKKIRRFCLGCEQPFIAAGLHIHTCERCKGKPEYESETEYSLGMIQ